MKRTIIATALLLTLSGCSTIKPLEVFSRPIEKTPLNLSDPKEIELDKVKFRLITEQNAEKVFKDLKDKNIDPVLIGFPVTIMRCHLHYPRSIYGIRSEYTDTE